MKTLKEIKDIVFKPEESNNNLQEFYKKLLSKLEDLNYIPTYSIDDIKKDILFMDNDDGINYELKIISNMINKTLGIPKLFWGHLFCLTLSEETNPHSGSFMWYNLGLEIYPPQSTLEYLDLDSYRNYEDLKWLMEESGSSYEALDKLKKLFPVQI